MSKVKIKLTTYPHIDNGKEYAVYDEKGQQLVHEVDQELLSRLDGCGARYEVVKEETKPGK